MKNKTFEINRLKDKLFRHDALNMFETAWSQLVQTGKYAIEANGGWVIGKTL